MNTAGRDDRSLIRIAAMLVALAALAERAGSRSFPVRWLVLCILRPAEAAAHGFVVAAMPVDWPGLEDVLATDNRPVDAAFLAWRFRLLAALLDALLRLRADGRHAGMACAPQSLAPARVLMIFFGGWPLRAYDTS